MKTLLFNKFTLVVFLIAVTFVGLTTDSAHAHTKCKIPLPFDGWTEGCPHFHPYPDDGGGSCLSFVTDDFYEFRITNRTGHKVNYSINGTWYSLSNGYYRNHKYQAAYGSSSCNIKHYPKPVIKFDSSYSSGLQWETYTLGDRYDSVRYKFSKSGYGIDLYIDR